MVVQVVLIDDVGEWCSVECEENWTQYRALRNSAAEFGRFGFVVIYCHYLKSVCKV